MLCFLISCCLPIIQILSIISCFSFANRSTTYLISWLATTTMYSSFFHGRGRRRLAIINPAVVNKQQAAIASENVDKKKKKKKNIQEEEAAVSLLDLPDLVLECILERLSPAGLCSAAVVSRSLRHRCITDYLWDKHFKHKWGTLIGPAASQKWQRHVNKLSQHRSTSRNQKGLVEYFQSTILWPIRRNYNESKVNCDDYDDHNHHDHLTSLPMNSIMAWYLHLETGKFWFPAQVYNREVQNGHVGFMFSCYDAQVCYDIRTDTFRARYSARGGQTMEENIEWYRLRKPAVDTTAHVLHFSDCLSDLKPSDHIEIQWRRSKEFPYGWWYGVVGHLESCNRDEFCCECHTSDTVVLEFKQYDPGSRWRYVVIHRKEHQEVGNEADGFYGGIRKLCHEEEISRWKHFWTISSL